MLILDRVLGLLGEARYAGRAVDRIALDSVEAAKTRMRLRTEAGRDVGIDLPRGTYLRDGAVLFDDRETLIAVARRAERALIIQLDPAHDIEQLVEAAARIGHALGNRHWRIEAQGCEIRVPVTTTDALTEGAIRDLGLTRVTLAFAEVQLGLERPVGGGHHHHTAE